MINLFYYFLLLLDKMMFCDFNILINKCKNYCTENTVINTVHSVLWGLYLFMFFRHKYRISFKMHNKIFCWKVVTTYTVASHETILSFLFLHNKIHKKRRILLDLFYLSSGTHNCPYTLIKLFFRLNKPMLYSY